ncbi:MAG: NAD(+)/NADH kinase, partial [Lachnospiraceae bacterium]|nr:NAD(+)/NADH kinase [Lachnospiraceae bacterium]
MKKFCIISNQDKDNGLKVAGFVAEEIAKRGGEARLLSTNEAAKAKGEGFTDLSGITGDTEGIIIIGGDGTMIQAARELVRFNLPIIGIDLGTLGYLAEVEPDDIEDALDRLFSGEYHIEERILLEGTVITYVAVGARSVEDQQHRLTASGIEVPVGMKNPTSGDYAVML